MHENMKTSMWHTGRSERTCRLPACFHVFLMKLWDAGGVTIRSTTLYTVTVSLIYWIRAYVSQRLPIRWNFFIWMYVSLPV